MTTAVKETLDQPFAIGDKVRMRTVTGGGPGTVVRYTKGRVVVQWPRFPGECLYKPHLLVKVEK